MRRDIENYVTVRSLLQGDVGSLIFWSAEIELVTSLTGKIVEMNRSRRTVERNRA